MPEYLVSGRTPEGRQVVERVEAETASEAVEQLKKRDITEVVLHTDDISHIVARQTQQQSNVPLAKVRQQITTRDSLTIMRDGTKLGRMRFLLRKSLVSNWMLFVVLLIVVVIRHQQQQAWQLTDYLLILVPTVYCLLWLPFRYAFLGPGATYHGLIEAGSWGRWDEVLRILPKLQGKISPHELACRKAEAISALGNLDAALEVVEPFADGQQIPLWMYYARLSSVYAWAHDFESSVRCCQKAAELAPDQATVLLDYAQAIIRRKRDPQAAQQVLDQAKKYPIPDVITYAVDQCQGLIALEERRAHAALEHLTQAMEKLQRYLKTNALLGSAKDRLHACLCLAYAACGDGDEARRHYQSAQPRLRALKYDDLIERCESALKRC